MKTGWKDEENAQVKERMETGIKIKERREVTMDQVHGS